MEEEDDNAYVIGNMMIHLDENNVQADKEELEMLTVEDLSNNGLFSEKIITTLNKDESLQMSDNNVQDCSEDKDCDQDSDNDATDDATDIPKRQDKIYRPYDQINSHLQLSSISINNGDAKKPNVSKEVSQQQENEIDNFNHILALRLSRKNQNSQKIITNFTHSGVVDRVVSENYEYISHTPPKSNSVIFDRYTSSDTIDSYSSNCVADFPNTSKSLSAAEEGKESSPLEEITIMKEEMVASVSDSEDIIDKTHNYDYFDHSFALKVTNTERTNIIPRRKRPVIHRKCKVNGKRNIDKLFKTRFLSRCLMKYRPNSDNTKLQKFVTFQCEKCEYSTNNRSNYKNHLLIHGEERLYQCPFCPYKSKQSAGLRAHYKVHSVDKPFACSFCHYKSKRKQNLVQHLKIHAKENPFRCEECPYQGSTKQLLQNHVLWHITRRQGKQMKDSEGGICECLLCSLTFPTEEDLSSHYDSHTDENDVTSTQEIGTLDKETHRKLERANLAFKCSQCDFITLRKCAFRNHVKSHSGNIQKCGSCNYKCNLNSKVFPKVECDQNKTPILECSYCEFKAISESDLLCHMDDIHKLKKDSKIVPKKEKVKLSTSNRFEYKCPFCRFTCVMGEILKVHICNHSNNDLKVYHSNDLESTSDLGNFTDLKLYHNNELQSTSDLRSFTMSNSYEKDSGDSGNELNDISIANTYGEVHTTEAGPEYCLRNNNRTDMTSKRSFNGELLMPLLESTNFDNSANDTFRQSSYATYNNYELISDSSYGEYQSQLHPMGKKFKRSEDSHTLHDSGCSCVNSIDGVNDEIDYETIKVSEVENLNSNGNISNYSGNYEYQKMDTSPSYSDTVENLGTHGQITVPPSGFQSDQRNNQENDIDTESIRILLHVLENANFDSKSKDNQVLNSMRTDDRYGTYISVSSLPRQDIARTCSYPSVTSQNQVLNYAFSSKEDAIFQDKVTEDNICDSRNVSNSTLSVSSYELTDSSNSWKQSGSQLPVSDNEDLVQTDINNVSLDNENIKRLHSSMEEYEDDVTNGVHNSDGLVDMSTDVIVEEKGELIGNHSRSSYENDINGLNSNESSISEGFDKKFERYVFSSQNQMEVVSSGICEYSDDQKPDAIEMLPNNLTKKSQNKRNGVKIESEPPIYSCNKCHVSFIKKTSLLNHNRTHSSNNFKCKSCSYRTKCRKSLRTHTKKHSHQAIFNCVQCDFATKRKCSLISHYRSHTQLYICSHCGFQCRLLRELESHNLIHDEEMSIKCMFCNFTTSKHKMLKYHMKKHTNNPRFKCMRCSFGFQTQDKFNSHVDAHAILDKQKSTNSEELDSLTPVDEKPSNSGSTKRSTY